MIEPKDYAHAVLCSKLSGTTGLAGKAFIDGYEGIDRSSRFNSYDRSFYDGYWLLGSYFKAREERGEVNEPT